MSIRVNFESAIRAAAVELLTDFASDEGLKLQVYRARPRTIYPPTAFVDSMAERIAYSNTVLRQRTPVATVVVVHGLYDSGEAVDQRDAFVDAFLDWVTDRYHAAGASTLIALTEVNDIPTWVPDWLPPENQKTYYATELTLEGYAGA